MYEVLTKLLASSTLSSGVREILEKVISKN